MGFLSRIEGPADLLRRLHQEHIHVPLLFVDDDSHFLLNELHNRRIQSVTASKNERFRPFDLIVTKKGHVKHRRTNVNRKHLLSLCSNKKQISVAHKTAGCVDTTPHFRLVQIACLFIEFLGKCKVHVVHFVVPVHLLIQLLHVLPGEFHAGYGIAPLRKGDCCEAIIVIDEIHERKQLLGLYLSSILCHPKESAEIADDTSASIILVDYVVFAVYVVQRSGKCAHFFRSGCC